MIEVFYIAKEIVYFIVFSNPSVLLGTFIWDKGVVTGWGGTTGFYKGVI